MHEHTHIYTILHPDSDQTNNVQNVDLRELYHGRTYMCGIQYERYTVAKMCLIHLRVNARQRGNPPQQQREVCKPPSITDTSNHEQRTMDV